MIDEYENELTVMLWTKLLKEFPNALNNDYRLVWDKEDD